MAGLLHFLALALYLAGSAGHVVFIVRQNRRALGLAHVFMAVGLVLHTAGLVLASLDLGHISAVNLSRSLSYLAWAVAAGYLLVWSRTRIQVLGAFAAPLALGLMILAWAGPAAPLKPLVGFNSLWLILHVVLCFLGEGFLVLAGISGVMYLLQEREIKSRRPGWFYSRLPSLVSLDNLGRQSLVLGFPLLTLGLLAGAVYGHFSAGVFWRWDGKEVSSLLAWLVFALLLHQRLAVGISGRRAAWLALAGLGAVAFTFLGAAFLFTTYHDFVTYGRPG